jgi:hypothetical protein
MRANGTTDTLNIRVGPRLRARILQAGGAAWVRGLILEALDGPNAHLVNWKE